MGRIPRCRSRSPGEKATLFQASNGEPGMDLAQSKTPRHAETSFVGTWKISPAPGRHTGPVHEGIETER